MSNPSRPSVTKHTGPRLLLPPSPRPSAGIYALISASLTRSFPSIISSIYSGTFLSSAWAPAAQRVHLLHLLVCGEGWLMVPVSLPEWGGSRRQRGTGLPASLGEGGHGTTLLSSLGLLSPGQRWIHGPARSPPCSHLATWLPLHQFPPQPWSPPSPTFAFLSPSPLLSQSCQPLAFKHHKPGHPESGYGL